MKEILFITGRARTGTTLVRTILNNSPSVYIAPETNFINCIYLKINNPNYKNVSLGKIIRDRSHDPGIKRFRTGVSTDETDIFKEFYTLLDANSGEAVIIGEKTPKLEFYTELLMSRYSNAKFILTVRDPRAQISSWIAKSGRDKSIYDLCFEWLGSIDHINYLVQNYPDQCFKLKYESLITDPERKIKEVCQFLNLEYSSDLLDHGLQNSSYIPQKQRYVKKEERKADEPQFFTENIDIWKEKGILSATEIGRINSLLVRGMKSEGYSLPDTFSPDVFSVINGFPYKIGNIKRKWSESKRINRLRDVP